MSQSSVAQATSTSAMKSLDLTAVAQQVLDTAKKAGADQVEVSIHQGSGSSVTARMGQLETLEKNNDSQISLSVYKNQCTGSASSADFSPQGIAQMVESAMSIAKYTEQDQALGLADAELMASKKSDFELYHPWDASEQQMLELAQQCEQAGFDSDQRISNSEGASVNSYAGQNVYANSHGFCHQNPSSSHSISVSLIAQQGDSMQRDYWYDSNVNPARLKSASKIGQLAAERSVRRLNARKIDSCEVPVIFDATVASSLFGHFLSAIKGGAIYKKASFLRDKVSEQIFPDWLSIIECPHLVGERSSSSYDREGVATAASNPLVTDGVLQRYVLGSYTARKLGLKTTANAGGVRNIRLESARTQTPPTQQELLKDMGQGLLITEMIGSGINMVTGDYSRGAVGFWIENGEIQYPVEEITIAGNLQAMFQSIQTIASDVFEYGNIHTGSVLLDRITVAGN
jgi:PmbA protein